MWHSTIIIPLGEVVVIIRAVVIVVVELALKTGLVLMTGLTLMTGLALMTGLVLMTGLALMTGVDSGVTLIVVKAMILLLVVATPLAVVENIKNIYIAMHVVLIQQMFLLGGNVFIVKLVGGPSWKPSI